MRKVLLFLVVLSALSLGVSAVAAQDATPIEYGQTVEGTISNQSYEFRYTFKGNEGDLIAITMDRGSEDSSLDATLILRDSNGDPLATNDDFRYPLSLIVYELPAQGEYTILATRSGGSTGSSDGDYFLKLELVDPLTSGSQLEATIYSDYTKQVSTIAYLVPEESGPVEITFSQELSDLYGSLRISETPDWASDVTSSYYETVVELSDSARVTNATLTVDLQAGHVYVLSVDVAFSSFSFDVDEATVTVSIG
jgi:hypothetical protein